MSSFNYPAFCGFCNGKNTRNGIQKISKKLSKFAKKSVDKYIVMWYINQAAAERGDAMYLEN